MNKAAKVFLSPVLAFYTLVFIAGAVYAALHPALNWDIIAYVGAILSTHADSARSLYDGTVQELSRVFMPDQSHPLFDSPAHFSQQLPFYRVKPFYLAAVRLLHAAGAGLTEATWLISALSFALLGGLLACWRPEKASWHVWLLSVVTLCLLGREAMMWLAALSTPDAFCLLWTMLAFLLWQQKRSAAGFAIPALLAILSRPDAVILMLALLGYFSLFAAKTARLKPPIAAGIAVVCLAVYAVNNALAGTYDWPTMFYYNFINRAPDIGEIKVQLSLRDYVEALLKGLQGGGLQLTRIPFFAGLSLAAVYAGGKQAPRHWLWLLAIVWGTLAARFLLFPSYEDRFYYAYYLLMLMACLEIAATRQKD